MAYNAGGPELTDIPWDVVATLTLDAGQAYGTASCNGFGAGYQLDGKTLSVGEPMRTFVGCPDARMAVEESYIAALPQVTRWAIDTGVTGDRDLILFDADDEHLLRFSSSGMGLLVGQIRALTEQVDAQQQVVGTCGRASRSSKRAAEPAAFAITAPRPWARRRRARRRSRWRRAV